MERPVYFCIYVAITRLGRHVGMHYPPPQNAFPSHPDLFENAGRADVFNVAHGPNPKNKIETSRPINDALRRLGHVPTLPIAPAEHIADVRSVLTDAAANHSDDPIFTSACD